MSAAGGEETVVLPRYRGLWTVVLAVAALALLWTFEGRAYVRRHFLGPSEVPEAARTGSQFLAVVFPRITPRGEKYALSARQLEGILGALRREGYVSIGVKDIRDCYADRRGLPPKAVLLAFGKDYPENVWLADRALERHRMRGLLFMSGSPAGTLLEKRRHLSEHAIRQLLKSGAWDLGWDSRDGPPSALEERRTSAWLVRPGEAAAKDGRDGPGASVRLVASQLGHNDRRDDPSSLHALVLDPGRPPEELVRVIRDAWPRRTQFADDFQGGLGPEWVVGWGHVSVRDGRLTLLPTPRHTGAAAFIRGTEKWRDVCLEFGLKDYREEAWVYARYRDDGGSVRAGARNGYWYVEQKAGRGGRNRMLGSAPIVEGSLPAKVRFVLKGDWALLHVNGRMMFGKALRLDPEVDYGRVQFETYNARLRSARAYFSYVKARPVGGDWFTWGGERSAGSFGDQDLEALREEATVSYGMSPRWVTVGPDGRVSRGGSQEEFVRSLAGFYRCQLVPMVEFTGGAASALASPANADRALRALAELASSSDDAGLNLRLRRRESGLAGTAAFVGRLRGELRRHRRRLWVTLDEGSPASAEPRLARAADGVLRPDRAEPGGRGIQRLRMADLRPED